MRSLPGLMAVTLWVAVLGAWLDLRADELSDDPDATVQGEYVGEVMGPESPCKLGIQVIALGRGKFRALWRTGGLPGEGWDNRESPPRDSEMEGKTTIFRLDGQTATLSDGKLRLTAGGKSIGELKRVARKSPTLGAKPSTGGIVLFDGKDADQFEGGRVTTDGLLKPGATSKYKHQSGTLHLEFQVPYGPLIPSRGNSGVYLQSRYEVQILDSFGLQPHNHECGGIPSIKEPDINMSFPPLAWQTYDVDFTAAEFADGRKVKSARMSVRHNGVLIHNDVELTHATTSSPLPEGPDAAPLNLQDHQAEVRFRNIWWVDRK